MLKSPCPCGQHKYHVLGDAAPATPTTTGPTFTQSAIQAGTNVANSLKTVNTTGVQNAGNVLSATASGAVVGAQIGGPWGAAIGAVVNTVVAIVPGLSFFAINQASQKAEDELGQVINQVSGGTLTANWTDPTMQNALNSLIYQDMTRNPSAWSGYLKSYGLPPYNTTDPQAQQFCNGGTWGVNCIWTVLLHTRPQDSTSTAAHKTYINNVLEFLTNLNKYLTGIGYTALANQVSADVVALQVAQNKINASQVLQAQAQAQKQVTASGISTATLATAAPMVLLGLAALAVFLTSPKKGESNAQ
jgi:hypothetical protein